MFGYKDNKPFVVKGGITRRWIIGNLSITVVILVVSVAVILLTLHRNYYSSAKQAVNYRVRTVLNSIPSAIEEGEDERANAARLIVENFEEKNRFEIMLINDEGHVIATSSGFGTSDDVIMSDYELAKASPDGYGEYTGRSRTRENIVAVTQILTYPAGNVSAIRLVSSLKEIDTHIQQIGYILGLACSVIISFSFFSGIFFIRSIAIPIRRIGAIASGIAAGDFESRIQKQRYNDEIQWLCDTINDMASELAESDRMKNEFISSVSHELRTPLTSIKGWGETLQAVGKENEIAFDKGIKIIIDETDRLSMLVEDLLDFSRILNGVIVLDQKQINFVDMLEDALLLVEQRAKGLGIEINYSEPAYSALVYADSRRMKQVFVNIIDNALKYSPAGGTIEIKVKKARRDVSVSISDNGPGIPEDEVDKVTQRFYKASNSVTGSGIGLAVVDEIVMLHSGRLAIDSILGKGTTVTVSLPLVLFEQEGNNK